MASRSFILHLRSCINALFSIGLVLFSQSCTKDKVPPSYNGYPEEVGKIFINSCATAGCHNDASHQAAAGLNLSSWDKLFEGTNTGAAVVPYNSSQSPLMYFINTFPELGAQAKPVMPYNEEALSKEQVLLVSDWIMRGAPDKNGFVKFSDNPSRKKIYVANQGCDQVTIIDAATKLAMRCVSVGNTGSIESPHMIRVSPDGLNWYVCFLNSNILQKFSTGDDKLIGNIIIGSGNWNTFTISSDSKTAYVVSWEPDGKVAVVNLEAMSLVATLGGAGFLKNPHGCMVSGTYLYVTAQSGNYIYKIPVNDPGNYEEIVLGEAEPVSQSSKYDAHEIIISPDGSKYFASCQASNEIRVMNAGNDAYITSIPFIFSPQEMCISTSVGYLFVSSPEDTVSFPGKRGSVSIIDYKTNTFVKKIYTGHQPHGIAVDDKQGFVFVAHRNINPLGPAPHHSSDCGGRNGYLTIIDVKTLELSPGYYSELSTDPYSVAFRD